MTLDNNQKKLVEENINMVYSVINSLRSLLCPSGDWETRHITSNKATVGDFLGAGYEALCKSAIYYNPDYGYTFSTYAYTSIKRSILREYSKNAINTDTTNECGYDIIYSLDHVINEGEKRETDLYDLNNLIDDVMKSSEIFTDIDNAINKSRCKNKDRLRAFIVLYYKGYTYREIASMYDVSQQYVSQQIKSIAKYMD